MSDLEHGPFDYRFGFKVSSYLNKDAGELTLSTEVQHPTHIEQISRDVVNFKDNLVREALIEIGWIPPETAEKLYIVSGYAHDPDEVRTQLIEASGFNDAEEKFVKAHFPEARNWDIQFNGTLANLLSNVLR